MTKRAVFELPIEWCCLLCGRPTVVPAPGARCWEEVVCSCSEASTKVDRHSTQPGWPRDRAWPVQRPPVESHRPRPIKPPSIGKGGR